MKKLAITALLFYAVFLSGDVIAQNSVIAHRLDPDYQIKSTLIVEYKYPSTITCFNTEDNRTVFVLGLSNHQTIEVEISGYYVTDMDVDFVNDTVYFCGYDLNSSHHGIVGFFDVDSVFYSSGNIYLHDFFLAGDENSYVKEFKKLVYYRKSDNTPYIACIGETSNDHPCIVDIYPCLMGTYTGGYVPNKEERFTDIKYVSYSTTQYAHYFGLVTSGTESTNGTFISLRYYDRDNVISSPGDQDYRNTFCVNMYDMRKWLLNDVLVTHVKNNDNIISTVSYRRSSDSLIFQSHNNIHVAFYDLRDMVVNHSLFSMTKSVEIPGVIKRFANPKPHRYISQASTFKTVFLQTVSASDSSNSTFCEINYTTLTTSGNINFFRDKDIRLQGLSRYNGTSNYIMSGYSVSNTSKLMYEMETFGNMSTCVEAKEYKYEDTEPMASIRERAPFIVLSCVYSPRPVEKRVKEVPIFIDCPKREQE